MYEISRSQPTDPNTVALIAQVLDFPVNYFYEYPSCTTSGTTYFRSLLTTSKKYRNEQVVKMEFLSQVYALLQDYIEFPKYETLSLDQNTTPEAAAYALRNSWGLGMEPIDNLISVVEQHGILVTSFTTSSDDVDAFSQFVDIGDSPTYLIAYSSNKTSAARIHFDIAHELGHICLHEWSEDIEDISKEDFKERERQANEFAAAFLLPEETFKVDALAGPCSTVYYKQLKKKWKVSIAAMIRRAAHLGVMSMGEYQSLMRIMQRRGQRKEEPLDDVLFTASPALLKASVIMLLQENVFSPKEFMDELSEKYNLSINATEIEYLLDLPHGTLSASKIIDLTSLQLKRDK
jgi:Zn-dependent peptidase ImmA (M78 family)